MNTSQKNMMFAFAFVLFVYLLCSKMGAARRPEKYVLSPSPLATDDKVQNASVGASLLKLPYTMACVPGPYPKGSYYTKGLLPGGICGDQAFVNAAMHEYSITGGIGGSIMNN
jgi:hypothetical protein